MPGLYGVVVCLCLSVTLSVNVYLFVCLSVRPAICLHVCLSVFVHACVCVPTSVCMLAHVEQPSNMPCVLSQSVCHGTHSICAPDQLCVYGAGETACTYADLTSQQQASSVIRALSQLAQDESICRWAHQLTVRACVHADSDNTAAGLICHQSPALFPRQAAHDGGVSSPAQGAPRVGPGPAQGP